MSVTQFEPMPHDLDAKVNYKRENPNDGQPYALIKISTGLNCDGFTRFDFGSVGYGEIDCTHGTWVYAPASASRVSITHTLAGTLENHLLPAPLEAGMVYSMTLEGGQVRTVREESLAAGFLVVECNVPGARVRIEANEPELMTGTRWSKTLPPGSYTYEISATGYEPERGRFNIRMEETTPVQVLLKSSNGTLRLASTPPGAAIFVNGQQRQERTPATLTLLKGSYHITLGKDLYKPTEQEVVIAPGEEQAVSISLEPNFATVKVEAANLTDSLWVDNRFRAKGLWQGDLSAGLHTLEVTRTSHRPFKRSFTVQPGQPQTIVADALQPVYGKLQVNVAQSLNAAVYVDGTERSNMTPCVVRDVLVGKRTVRLVPEDDTYQPYETEVAIQEAEITDLVVTLVEKPKTGVLNISSDVDFEAYVDDRYTGRSSAKALSLTLPVGKHKIKLSESNYEPITEEIEIKPGEQNMHRSLKSTVGSIYVNANVPAKVYVDGVYYGDVGELITLPLGEHEVVWEYGKMKKKENVDVEPNRQQYVYKAFNIKYKGSQKSSYSTARQSGSSYRPSTYRYKKTREYIDSYFYMDYRMSAGNYGVSPIGFSMGYSGRWGGYYQFRAGKRIFHLTGGIMYNPTSWLALQAGAGWGGELIEGETGASGLEFEIGAIYRMDVLLISAGYSYVPGLRCHEGYIGIGFYI